MAEATDGGAEPAGMEGLLGRPLHVINLGLEGFAIELAQAGVPVVHVDWRPPAGGDRRLGALLARLDDDEEAERERP